MIRATKCVHKTHKPLECDRGYCPVRSYALNFESDSGYLYSGCQYKVRLKEARRALTATATKRIWTKRLVSARLSRRELGEKGSVLRGKGAAAREVQAVCYVVCQAMAAPSTCPVTTLPI